MDLQAHKLSLKLIRLIKGRAEIMKKIICLFIILLSTFSFAADNQPDRNEDEEGTLSTEQPRNSSRSEVDALRGRRAAPRGSQYPPDNRDLEREINRRRNSSAAHSQNSTLKMKILTRLGEERKEGLLAGF